MDITQFTLEEAYNLASLITWCVGGAIIAFFVLAAICSKLGKASEFVSYTPNLLTSLGIFGTFAGIFVGLMAFDANDIDGSVEGLLNGLKTAFLTSIIGVFASIIFKLLSSTSLVRSSINTSDVGSATPEDILAAINDQKESLNLLLKFIGGEGDGSIVSQMKLLRADQNDNHKMLLHVSKESSVSLTQISHQISDQKESFIGFKDKLWIKMQDFADMLSKSATETVIEALKQVITDFNNNLNEQFGDNFKQLNEAVKELVLWQENYKVQIADMTEQYKLGVASIAATEVSIAHISTESKAIPESMANLREVMEVNRHQLGELERHLIAFKDIRDRAVEAVPEIRAQIDQTVNIISDSVEKASLHYNQLLIESDKYIQSYTSTSNELLDRFVANTNEGISIISEKLSDSASKVEQVITEGANDFTDKIHRTNSSLQTSADYLTIQTESIKNYLQDTVEDMNNHFRVMVQGIVEDSQKLSLTLVDANKALISDTASVRDSVAQSIDALQKRLEASMEDVFASQTQHMNKVFSNIDASLKNQVGKTGEAVEKQLTMIDQVMQQEINKVMNSMGHKLGQIAGQFVKDYSSLTDKMIKIVNRAE